VRDFVQARERAWRWWSGDQAKACRPLVSLVALRPEDEFEVGRPAQGIALRVRCAWKNTPQGMPQTPLTEFVALLVGGADVLPTLVEKKRTNGSGLADRYHLYAVPEGADGKTGTRTATVVAREIVTKREVTQTVRF
jgi:hypothetical protein